MERLPSYLCSSLSILELFSADMELGELTPWGFECPKGYFSVFQKKANEISDQSNF